MMGFLAKWRDDAYYSKARKRLGRISPQQVLAWSDSALWGTQEYLDVYRKERTPAALMEARKGALGLLASLDELLDRPL